MRRRRSPPPCASPDQPLDVRDKVFPGEGHITVQGALIANGMSFILPYPKRPATAK